MPITGAFERYHLKTAVISIRQQLHICFFVQFHRQETEDNLWHKNWDFSFSFLHYLVKKNKSINLHSLIVFCVTTKFQLTLNM